MKVEMENLEKKQGDLDRKIEDWDRNKKAYAMRDCNTLRQFKCLTNFDRIFFFDWVAKEKLDKIKKAQKQLDHSRDTLKRDEAALQNQKSNFRKPINQI